MASRQRAGNPVGIRPWRIMTPEQRARLDEGRAAIHQRWLAGRYLSELGPTPRSALSLARIVTRPESDAILRYRLFEEAGLGIDEITLPKGYRFSALSQPEDVYDKVKAFGTAMDDKVAHFCPTRFKARTDSGMWSCDEQPVFEIQFGWARIHFPELYVAARWGCNLTTQCGRAGILARTACGYGDRHPDEPVFEVACWGGATEVVL